MAVTKVKSPWWVNLMRYFARGLMILWAGFWIFFAVASAISETSPDPNANALGWMVVIIGTILLAAGAIIPWIWERIAGYLLITEGVFFLVFFLIVASGDVNLAMFLIILPAFISGGLSLTCWYLTHKKDLNKSS
ncbi:hypothetical protein GF359_05290 [candidate division WOR-3 bacterium]|uniref:DUF7670 domain-containing protein n=1 Tax=candidate division WOR-3 bacterium TaxID=2052148 RepID=A0A9D5K9H3_UNCW3|nr:hypothetical protein [candidate division WOR-3 bacterium]MBD3364610.1 hypothetical protein [candidate division WOR-3 bacterium]